MHGGQHYVGGCMLNILIILVERAKPQGFSLPQSSYHRLSWGWFGPAMWPLAHLSSATMLVGGVRSGMIAVDLTFLWHFSVTIT